MNSDTLLSLECVEFDVISFIFGLTPTDLNSLALNGAILNTV